MHFEKARTYVRFLNLRTAAEWDAWASSDLRPAIIPRTPQRVYRKTGWRGFQDWLIDPRKESAADKKRMDEKRSKGRRKHPTRSGLKPRRKLFGISHKYRESDIKIQRVYNTSNSKQFLKPAPTNNPNNFPGDEVTNNSIFPAVRDQPETVNSLEDWRKGPAESEQQDLRPESEPESAPNLESESVPKAQPESEAHPGSESDPDPAATRKQRAVAAIEQAIAELQAGNLTAVTVSILEPLLQAAQLGHILENKHWQDAIESTLTSVPLKRQAADASRGAQHAKSSQAPTRKRTRKMVKQTPLSMYRSKLMDARAAKAKQKRPTKKEQSSEDKNKTETKPKSTSKPKTKRKFKRKQNRAKKETPAQTVSVPRPLKRQPSSPLHAPQPPIPPEALEDFEQLRQDHKKLNSDLLAAVKGYEEVSPM